MTKSELIEALAAQQSHLAFNDVELAVKNALEQMSQALARGEAMGRIAVVQTTSSESRKRLDAFAKGNPYLVQVKRFLWRPSNPWGRWPSYMRCRRSKIRPGLSFLAATPRSRSPPISSPTNG